MVYRNERAVASEFSDPAAEMFFALYQKLLVKKKITEGSRPFRRQENWCSQHRLLQFQPSSAETGEPIFAAT
jgi:hypothetical protein